MQLRRERDGTGFLLARCIVEGQHDRAAQSSTPLFGQHGDAPDMDSPVRLMEQQTARGRCYAVHSGEDVDGTADQCGILVVFVDLEVFGDALLLDEHDATNRKRFLHLVKRSDADDFQAHNRYNRQARGRQDSTGNAGPGLQAEAPSPSLIRWQTLIGDKQLAYAA